jgi:hypothetical protein
MVKPRILHKQRGIRVTDRIPIRPVKSITLLPRERLREVGWTKRRLTQAKLGKPCVYCGVASSTTRDHVFPRVLFDPVPTNAITVPACLPCNQKKAIGDDMLDFVVTFSQDALLVPSDFAHIDRQARAMMQNQSVLGRIAHEAYRVRKQVDPFERGGPLPIDFDGSALNATLEMMMRGIFFTVHGRVLPPSTPVAVTELSQPEGAEWVWRLVSDPDHFLGFRGDEMDVLWLMSPLDWIDEYSALCVFLFRRGVFYLGASGFFARHKQAA